MYCVWYALWWHRQERTNNRGLRKQQRHSNGQYRLKKKEESWHKHTHEINKPHVLKEWLTVPLELSTVTVISSANSCLAFCGETTSNFPPVTAKVVKSVNLFTESWVEFCQLELVLKRSINYMQYSTKNGIFTTSWNFYNDSFFQNQFPAVLAKRGSPKAMTGTNMWSFFTGIWRESK